MIMKGLKLTMYYFLYLLSKQEFGQRNGNPLQYSCLENPVDRGAWQATVHGVAKSQTGLKRLECTHVATKMVEENRARFFICKPLFLNS